MLAIVPLHDKDGSGQDTVKKVLVLCDAEGVAENRENVQQLWSACHINSIKVVFCCDYKMVALIAGGQPATSKFPCMICTGTKSKETLDWKEGHLRKIGEMRAQVQAWIDQGSNKKRAQDFESCVAFPMMDDDDETLLLSLFVPAELHLLLG